MAGRAGALMCVSTKSSLLLCTDWRDLSRHPKECLESSMDTAVSVSGEFRSIFHTGALYSRTGACCDALHIMPEAQFYVSS